MRFILFTFLVNRFTMYSCTKDIEHYSMDCVASKYNAEVHLNEAHDKGSTITRSQRLPQSVVLLPRQRSFLNIWKYASRLIV